jgi:hypothetical protein
MTRPTTTKNKRVVASVQSVATILGISLDEVLDLVQRGRIKAKRRRTRLQVDVLSPYDEYEIDYDSAFQYHNKLIEQRAKAAKNAVGPASDEKVLDITRRGSR